MFSLLLHITGLSSHRFPIVLYLLCWHFRLGCVRTVYIILGTGVVVVVVVVVHTSSFPEYVK